MEGVSFVCVCVFFFLRGFVLFFLFIFLFVLFPIGADKMIALTNFKRKFLQFA